MFVFIHVDVVRCIHLQFFLYNMGPLIHYYYYNQEFIKPICLIFYLAHIFLDVISGRDHIRYHKGVNWSNFDILCNNSVLK